MFRWINNYIDRASPRKLNHLAMGCGLLALGLQWFSGMVNTAQNGKYVDERVDDAVNRRYSRLLEKMGIDDE